jgi:hypothetical protein
MSSSTSSPRTNITIQGPGGSADANTARQFATLIPPVPRTASFTLADADAGKMQDCNLATTLTVTLPNNLTVGASFTFRQAGVGEILFSPASGATLQAPDGANRTNGQFATALLVVVSNTSGTNAVYALAGRIY